MLSVFGSFAALMYMGIHAFHKGQGGSFPFFRFQPANSSHTVIWDKPEAQPTNVELGWAKSILKRDRDARVGNAILTYRGLDGRTKFRIDVILPHLDSQYTYRRQFEIADSKKGFQVGGERFTLVSAGKSHISLLHYRPSP